MSRKSALDNVLQFPFKAPQFLTIELPSWARAGDKFEAVILTDDAMSGAGIHKGDVALIQRGLTRADEPHAVQLTTGERYIAFITHKASEVFLCRANERYRTKVFRHDEVRILGCVVRVYAGGDMQKGKDICPYEHVANADLIG